MVWSRNPALWCHAVECTLHVSEISAASNIFICFMGYFLNLWKHQRFTHCFHFDSGGCVTTSAAVSKMEGLGPFASPDLIRTNTKCNNNWENVDTCGVTMFFLWSYSNIWNPSRNGLKLTVKSVSKISKTDDNSKTSSRWKTCYDFLTTEISLTDFRCQC